MNGDKKSIALISDDHAATAVVSSALRAMPKVILEEHSATLSSMNGSVVALAAAHDIVIFRLDSTAENDLAAISALNKALAPDGVLLALADAGISLADARRLTSAGVDEVLPYPATAKEMQEHVVRWSKPAAIQLLPDLYRGTTKGGLIAVTQARGGIGSTTIAVNLADRLLDRAGLLKKVARNRVALVDLDLQFGAIASFLDIGSSEFLYQLATDGTMPAAAALQLAMIRLPSGLSVLTAPASFAPMEALKAQQIAQLLDLLLADYDYVVVDLPRTLVDWVSPVLNRADRLLLVTDSSVPSIRQARRLIDFYIDENNALPIEIVIGHEKKPLLTRGHHTEAAKILERPLSHWIAEDPVAAREAIDRGVPLSVAAPRAAITKAINALGRSTLAALSAAAKQTGTNG